jgi:hypothetical protein
MKFARIISLLVLFGFATGVVADEIIELSRAQLNADRQAIVSSGMMLTDEAGAKFWPIYREYHAELDSLDDKLYGLIERYAALYVNGGVPDEKAIGLVNELTDLEMTKLKLRKKYVKKFNKVLPGGLVARYFQIEHKLDTLVRVSIASEVPLTK